MVWEFITAFNIIVNDYFIQHISFISHILAAVFLVLTETTMNMRVITPILDIMEGAMIGNIPILPNFITAALFIIWATISIYVYQWIFQAVLVRYQPYLSGILLGVFVLVTIAVNIKYRD